MSNKNAFEKALLLLKRQKCLFAGIGSACKKMSAFADMIEIYCRKAIH